MVLDAQLIFQHAFSNSPIGMAIAGLDCQTFMVNPAFCKLLGYSEEEWLQLSGHDITHPEDVDYSFISDMMNGTIVTYKTRKRYVDRDGNAVPVSAHYSLLADDEDKPLFLIIQAIPLAAAHVNVCN